MSWSVCTSQISTSPQACGLGLHLRQYVIRWFQKLHRLVPDLYLMALNSGNNSLISIKFLSWGFHTVSENRVVDTVWNHVEWLASYKIPKIKTDLKSNWCFILKQLLQIDSSLIESYEVWLYNLNQKQSQFAVTWFIPYFSPLPILN